MGRVEERPEPDIVGGTGRVRISRQERLAEQATEGGAVGAIGTGTTVGASSTAAQEQTIQDLRDKLQAVREKAAEKRKTIQGLKQAARDRKQKIKELKTRLERGPSKEERRQIAREAMRTLLTVLRNRGVI